MPRKPKAHQMAFHPGDWKKDPNLSLCAPATRGIWMDAICTMHELDQCGKLVGSVDSLAQACRCTRVEMRAAIDDLNTTKTALVTEKAGIVTLINRRMSQSYKSRIASRKRKNKQRGHGNVTPVSHESHSPIPITSLPSLPPPPTPPRSEAAAASGKNAEERPGLRAVLRRLGVQGRALESCCGVHGLTAAGVAVLATELDGQKRAGRINAVAGVLVSRLTNGYIPPKLIKPEEITAISKTWDVTRVCEFDTRGKRLTHSSNALCVENNGDVLRIPSCELKPENITIEAR